MLVFVIGSANVIIIFDTAKKCAVFNEQLYLVLGEKSFFIRIPCNCFVNKLEISIFA